MEIELTMPMALEIFRKVTGDDALPVDRHAIFSEILDVLEANTPDDAREVISGWGLDAETATKTVVGIKKEYARLRKANVRARRKHG